MKLEKNFTWEEIADKTVNRFDNYKSNGEMKKFREFVLSNERVGYRFDYRMIRRAFKIYNDLRIDKDHFAVFSGLEGEGKTTFASQVCAWVDPTFSLDRYCFSISDFIDALKDSEQTNAILLDEGGQLLFSRDAMKLSSKLMARASMIMRRKNLFIAICIPNFHFLDSMIRDHRVQTLLQIKKRGKYKGFLPRAIKTVSKDGSRYKTVLNVKVPEGTFWDNGDFNKAFPKTIDYDAYLRKKDAHIAEFIDGMKEDIVDTKLVPVKRITKETGLTPKVIKGMIKNGEINGKQLGRFWFVDRKSYQKLLNT